MIDEGETGWAAGAPALAGDAIAAGICRGATRRLIDEGQKSASRRGRKAAAKH